MENKQFEELMTCFTKDKEDLEAEILNKVCEIVVDFKSRTSLTPCLIEIEVSEVTNTCDKFTQFLPTSVNTGFNLKRVENSS